MQFTSMRAFYLKNATPNSCNYCAFTRKMKNLKKDLKENSGIQQINPTFILVDTNKSHLYQALMQKRSKQIVIK